MIASLLFRAKHYLIHLFSANGAHALHSPFVYTLYTRVIKKASKNKFADIEQLRKKLKKNHSLIDVMDIKNQKNETKSISSVAKTSLSEPKFSSFLRLLIEYLNAKAALETGTSFGINALYIAKASCIDKVVTIEGSPIIHGITQKHFSNQPKIDSIQGNIYDVFIPSIITHEPEVIFLDADHRGSAIDFYLENIILHVPNVKCIIIHDIYWSPDMHEKWQQIVVDKRFKLTVDIFQAGLIFPNHQSPKQHFKLKF